MGLYKNMGLYAGMALYAGIKVVLLKSTKEVRSTLLKITVQTKTTDDCVEMYQKKPSMHYAQMVSRVSKPGGGGGGGYELLVVNVHGRCTT